MTDDPYSIPPFVGPTGGLSQSTRTPQPRPGSTEEPKQASAILSFRVTQLHELLAKHPAIYGELRPIESALSGIVGDVTDLEESHAELDAEIYRTSAALGDGHYESISKHAAALVKECDALRAESAELRTKLETRNGHA